MSSPQVLESCWVHDAVHVGSSLIEGRGLFAISRIRAGTVVARLGGRIVSRAELDRMLAAAEADPDSPYIDCVSLDTGVDLVLVAADVIHCANHGCDPNLWHEDAVTISARRDIEEGEELTIDYATHTDNPEFVMRCHCGASVCRGEVTGADWRRPSLQEIYREHWTPALLRRIWAEAVDV